MTHALRLSREEKETIITMALGTQEDALLALLRDIRGELAGIRTRLDSLEQHLRVHTDPRRRTRDSIVRNPWDIPTT